jgi:hypothetical protein
MKVTVAIRVKTIESETEKAIKVLVYFSKRDGLGTFSFWMPKSQVVSSKPLFETEQILEVNSWIAEQKAQELGRIMLHNNITSSSIFNC